MAHCRGEGTAPTAHVTCTDKETVSARTHTHAANSALLVLVVHSGVLVDFSSSSTYDPNGVLTHAVCIRSAAAASVRAVSINGALVQIQLMNVAAQPRARPHCFSSVDGDITCLFADVFVPLRSVKGCQSQPEPTDCVNHLPSAL